MDYDASIVPYTNCTGTATHCGESSANGTGGAVLRHNRLLEVNGNNQEFKLHEEVILSDNTFHRERLEHEMWESRRRMDEHEIALDIRSQQLLNYTNEHVEHSRAESERKIEAFMDEKLQSSHDNITDSIREQTRSLAHQIQDQLYAERQRDVGSMEARFTQQSSHFHKAIELSEQRSRTDTRKVAAAQVQGWNEQLEAVKMWTREYVDTAIQTHDEVSRSSHLDKVQQYVDQRFSCYEAHVEDVSARLREERAAITKNTQECASHAQKDLEKRVDAKITALKGIHNKALEGFLGQRVVDFEQKAKVDMLNFERITGSKINAELRRSVTQHENQLAAAIQQQLEIEHLRREEILMAKVDTAVESAIQKAIPHIQKTTGGTAAQDCLQRQLRAHFAAASTLTTPNTECKPSTQPTKSKTSALKQQMIKAVKPEKRPPLMEATRKSRRFVGGRKPSGVSKKKKTVLSEYELIRNVK